jgi:hypothetical protein
MAAATAVAKNFRGVLCRRCGKPVRVPALVSQKDSESHTHQDSSEMQYQLVSRVFVLRCRSCEKESVYAINQIVDCNLPSLPAMAARSDATL